MDLTNVQPTTPIGGYAAGGAPSEPDELGSRESARAVLSAMLETPADPGSASAGGGGINLQSVMGQLVGTGLRESVTAEASELPVFAKLLDASGAVLSPEMKEQVATELTAMVMKTFATAASPLASPTKQTTAQSPIRVLETAIATSLASNSNGKSSATGNPMQRAVQAKRVAIVAFLGQADQACLEFQEAEDRHVVAGKDLGSYMALSRELKAQDHNTSEGAQRILDINGLPLMQRTAKEYSDELSSADTYKKFTEERMWGVMTTSNVRLDKSTYAMFEFPKIVEPTDRKAVLLSFLEWTKKAAVVKKYYALIADMRAMATVMDAVTGVYEQPRKKATAVLKERYRRQDSDLATELRAEVTQIEFTSLWRGSATVGAGDYRKLYQVDPESGLDMLYVWISQYVVIETGTDRTDLLMQLRGIESLFQGPTPMNANEANIRNVLERCNEGGVTPDWLSHGSKCVKAVINRGQAYSDECTRLGLRKGSEWSKEPQASDVTRMLLDLITVTKQVDNEEMLEEQDDKDMKAGKKLGKMAAMQVDILSASVTDELSSSTLSDASSMSTSSYEKVAAFLTENHPDINLTTSKHDNKLVAGAVLLKNGQQLTMDKLAQAARLVGKGKGKSKGGGTRGTYTCAAKLCDKEVRREGFYCKQHWERKPREGDSKRKVTWGDDSDNKWNRGNKPKGKGAKGRKGKDGKGNKGKKGKQVKITTSDSNNKVSSYYVDAYTLDTIAKIKEGGGQCMTAEEVKQHKQASTAASVQALLQQ